MNLIFQAPPPARFLLNVEGFEYARLPLNTPTLEGEAANCALRQNEVGGEVKANTHLDLTRQTTNLHAESATIARLKGTNTLHGTADMINAKETGDIRIP